MSYWLIAYLISVLITAFLLIIVEARKSNQIYLDNLLVLIGISMLPVGNVFICIEAVVQSCKGIVIWEKTK